MNNQMLWQSRIAPIRDPGAWLHVKIYMAEKSLQMTSDSFPIFRNLLQPPVQLTSISYFCKSYCFKGFAQIRTVKQCAF